jgi:hypothetical protein
MLEESFYRPKYITSTEFLKLRDELIKLKQTRTQTADKTLHVILLTLGMTLEGGNDFEEKWGRG